MSESWRDQTVTWGVLANILGIDRGFDCHVGGEHGPHLVLTSNKESRVCSGKTWVDIRPLTRGELENLLDEKLQDGQWERIKNYVRYREAR